MCALNGDKRQITIMSLSSKPMSLYHILVYKVEPPNYWKKNIFFSKYTTISLPLLRGTITFYAHHLQLKTKGKKKEISQNRKREKVENKKQNHLNHIKPLLCFYSQNQY